MNRAMLRASKKIGRALMKQPKDRFLELPYSEIQRVRVGKKPDRAWKNNHHVVLLYKNERTILGIKMDKYMIRRNDSEPIKDWHEIQDVKNDVIGSDVEAYQVFPKSYDLVDVANMYWLFVPSELKNETI